MADPSAVGTGRAYVLLDVISGAFGAAYLQQAVLVPLYANAQGASVVTIGLLAGSPVFILLLMRLFVGPLTALWGERTLIAVTAGLSLGSGLVVPLTRGGMTGLVASQVLMGGARGIFWVVVQAYIGRLPGDVASAIGRNSSFANLGSLAGMLLAGALASHIGFLSAFGVVAVLAAACLAGSLALPALPRPPAARLGTGMLSMLESFRSAHIWFCAGLGAITAIPQALTQSFAPIFVLRLGGSLSQSADVTSFFYIGTIATGFVAAWLLRRFTATRTMGISVALIGAALAAGGLCRGPLVYALMVGLAGASSQVVYVFYVSAVAMASTDANRANNLAAANITFALAMGVTPAAFGFVAARLGIAGGFVAFGLGVLAVAYLAPSLYARSKAATRPPT